MHFLLYFLLIGCLLIELQSAPTHPDKRNSKQLYYDYLQTDSGSDDDDNDYHNEFDLNNDYINDDNDISRTIQGRRRLKPNQFESPVYYIRLPPQPYMFVPGLGYISQPPPPPPPMLPQSAAGEFLNLPVNFLSNGKPSTIYQWNGGVNFPTEPPPPVQQPVKPQRPDSTIHRLPGKYPFNGKPEDIFILRDSYNSLYSDALTNFYP